MVDKKSGPNRSRKQRSASRLQSPFIGETEATAQLLELVERIAPAEYPVLITGEVGTGKSLIAQYIHTLSSRRNGPFVTVDLPILSRGTATAELFGHTRGSFTGAVSNRPGLLRSAEGGTLYLDGIEGAPIEVQSALLRFTESGEVLPVGSDRAMRVDARLIASTASDPHLLASDGKLSRDLISRLSILQVQIPPLRDRRADIPILAEHFLKELRHGLGSEKLSLSEEAKQLLMGYAFPGNVRELRSIIQGASIVAQEDEILVEHLRLQPEIEQEPSRETAATLAEVRALRREIEYLKSTTIPAAPIWEGRHFQLQRDLCFVLMPFADECIGMGSSLRLTLVANLSRFKGA
ncbi:MAG: sigma-54-dependent Fis family transcriptional regulator [Spirochaetales bacterium]|nr:sigma-54-dependent Fis family transcriptional regulator [Spirochaetales bacterium]